MSKKVLIIGGYGGLGYEVAKVFIENGWEVSIEDRDSISHWNDNLDTKVEDITHIRVAPGYFRVLNVDAIIFIAETNDINASHDDILVKNNVVTPTYIASNLAHSKCKRLVVVGWQENFGNFNLLTRTLKERVEYMAFFNKGNNVISHMYLPRLIGPYHHHRTFGNIVKRVYTHLSINHMPIGIKEEISSDTSIRDSRELKPVSFMDSRAAAICVYEQACRNTREYTVPGITKDFLEYPLSIAKYVSSLLGITGAEFRTDKESHNIDSVTIMPHEPVQKMITECIDVWERERNRNQESSGGMFELAQ